MSLLGFTVSAKWLAAVPIASGALLYHADDEDHADAPAKKVLNATDNKDEDFEEEKDHVSIGTALGWGVTAVAGVAGYTLFSIDHTELDTIGSRLAYAFQWEALSLFPLMSSVSNVTKLRHSGDKDTLDGDDTASVEIEKRILANTVEQTLLAIPAHLILTTQLSAYNMQMIPVLVSTFLTGRLLFAHGYRSAKKGHRAGATSIGFAMSFYPTVATILFCAAALLKDLVLES